MAHPSPVIAPDSDEVETEADPAWVIDYRKHALEAFIAGVLMAVVSRISHILVKPGVLRHEAYMSMFAYLMCFITMPVFVVANWRFEHEARDRHKLDEIPLYVKVSGFFVLFMLLLVKNYHMERGIMKRFIEDYDPEVHENFPCFGSAPSDTEPVELQSNANEYESNRDSQAAVPENNRDLLREESSATERRYTSHVRG